MRLYSKAISSKSFNKFLLSVIALAAIHLGYVITRPEHTGIEEFFPLAIDSLVLFVTFLAIVLLGWLVERFPVGKETTVTDLLSSLTFFVLTLSAFSVLVYTAHTGDRLNFSLAIYFLRHPDELITPIVAETGYLTMLTVCTVSILTGLVLHHAHRLGARHLLLVFLVSTLGITMASAYAAQKGLRVYSFFSPGGLTAESPPIDGQPDTTPAWFRSFYLSLLDWTGNTPSLEENFVPSTQYKISSYESQTQNKPNILLLVMESVRASATSPYNSTPDISRLTPNIDRLAKSGVTVKNAYTTVPHTSKALVGIFCGQFSSQDAEISESRPGGLPVACLPRILFSAGYRSAFFQSAFGEFENRHGLTRNMGFQHTFAQEQLPERKNFKVVGYAGADDYIMLKPAISWMKTRADKGEPFFAGMLTVVSHHPYSTPGDSSDEDSSHANHIALSYSNYLSSVGYTDRFIGDLIHEMEKAGLMKNTIVIITGDHGEAFGEHGFTTHNNTLHEEGMKVPLVLYSPDLLPQPRQIEGLRSHLDLLPTVLEMTGFKFTGNLPGKSLWEPKGHDSLVGACWNTQHCAVLYKNDGGKFIYWRSGRLNEYYQLTRDPAEKNNMLAKMTSAEKDELMSSIFNQLKSYQTAYEH